MAATDIADPNAPELASVRANLARLFLEHRADLGLTLAWR